MERTAHNGPEAREHTALGKHPSAGVCVEQAMVRVHDLNGRLVTEQRIAAGSALVELHLSGEPAGVYASELWLDGVRSGTVKLTVY